MLVVLTAPRKRSYLANTLRDIDRSATSMRKHVICDGSVPPLPPGWCAEPFVRPVAERQNKWAAWHAIDMAVEAKDDLILFEDDLRLCGSAAYVIERMAVPPACAFLSFYAADNGRNGIRVQSVRVFLYAQCLKVPLRSCRALNALRWQMETCSADGVDEAIGAIAPSKWVFGTCIPGLVQHVGGESAVGNGALKGRRVSSAYAGDAFDARCLL
jgi:hypothetical protein